MFEVRFHLQSGKNYKKWQAKLRIKNSVEKVYYYDPFSVQLLLKDCVLINKKNEAKKVNAAGKRDVCGWIKCREIEVKKSGEIAVEQNAMLLYDPLIDPHWRKADCSEIFDDVQYQSLVTSGKRVFETT